MTRGEYWTMLLLAIEDAKARDAEHAAEAITLEAKTAVLEAITTVIRPQCNEVMRENWQQLQGSLQGVREAVMSSIVSMLEGFETREQ